MMQILCFPNRISVTNLANDTASFSYSIKIIFDIINQKKARQFQSSKKLDMKL